MFENWRGVYDYKALADALDFISFMTYAQHTGGSTPGPVAGYTWMEDALKFVLSLGVPPSKISLGIPVVLGLVVLDRTTRSPVRACAGTTSRTRPPPGFSRSFGAQPTWDDREKSPYAFWSNNGVNELLWMEDARAFMAKLELVRSTVFAAIPCGCSASRIPKRGTLSPPRADVCHPDATLSVAKGSGGPAFLLLSVKEERVLRPLRGHQDDKGF